MTTATPTRSPALGAFPQVPAWDAQLFSKPTAVFRGAPFWSWNGKLDRDRLLKQLRTFEAMGIGGGHMHARTGLATPYLGDEFLGHVVDVTDEAQRRGMLAWLYDEDRWPSGFAGGLVTSDKTLRCRHLLLTRRRPVPGEARRHPVHHGPPQEVTERTFVAAWALRFEGEALAASRRIEQADDASPGEVALYAYIEVAPDRSWFNNQQYANLLDPKAIARFIEVTHERYASVLGDRFGKSIPAIFTDEPLFRGMDRPDSATDARDLRIAWADDLPDTYRERFNEDLLDRLPAVLFDAADGSSGEARWRFRDHHTQRFVDAFAAQVGRWCEDHGIALTGHLMEEPALGRQSDWVGEVMRSLRHFQLPGIDLLCDNIEYTTAKQAQSVARQCDRPGVLSELYGVTNWDFPFEGHLRQGNWQAALGITVRVHHLSWYSMAGEAKRDYPASIGWHVPWWPEYPAVEDHFARVAVAMQTGRPICRVAMLHPIESRWIVDGPRAAHADTQAMLEEGFADTLTWLLEGQVDADLIAESLLPELCPVEASSKLNIGVMAYNAVVLPPLLTIRSTTLDRLDALSAAGGVVICLGTPPALVDGKPSDAAHRSAGRWQRCEANQAALMAAVAPWREVEVRSGAARAAGVVYQLREEADGQRILFVCRSDKSRPLHNATLRIKGHWHLQSLDTLTAATDEPGEVWTDDGWTHTPIDLPVAGHALLRLQPAKQPAPPKPVKAWHEASRLNDPVPFTLSEPNVLLLDRAAWKIDGGSWQPEEEVLRLDNMARAAVGLSPRHGNIAQPWVEPPAKPTHTVTLQFTLVTDVAVRSPRLALERADQATILLNGQPITASVEGYFVDEDIAAVALPDLPAGTLSLEVSWPFGPSHALEACYLLGDFGVGVAGRHARITALPGTLAFGDWTTQGLPFYGGNVTYHCTLDRPAGPCALRVPRFEAPLLAVDSQGQRLGRIIREPHRLVLPDRPAGPMTLDLTAFGDRFNTFGPLHNIDPHESWYGPRAWRTRGENWTDGYRVRPKGIIAAPMIESLAPQP